jgi:hypothetical protein
VNPKERTMGNTPKECARQYRFPLFSFNEVATMPAEEWDEVCRMCGADMEPRRDEPEPPHNPHAQKNT